LGFGRIYAAEVWARDTLGCALDAEHVRGIHQSLSSSGKPAFQLDDDPEHWFVLEDDHFERTSTVLTPFPTTQVRAYTGPVQYFDGGLMLYTTETSGQHRILALGVSPVGGPWRAWPDPPE
jgi:hypothetical protein